MVGHLMDAGHTVTIHTRTPASARSLLDRGAQWGETPAATAHEQDVLFSMVSMPSDVEEVYLGKSGTLAAASPPALMVDMTSSRPALARKIDEAARGRGVASLDAPVTGGDIGARNATLSILVGGSVEAFDSARPLFGLMGKTIVHQGGAGCGQQAKIANQILIASTMIGICEALIFARATGLDAAKLLESVSAGAAGSWSLANLAPRIIRGDFAPGFLIDHFVKDLGIALAECRQSGLQLPGLELAERLYRMAQDGNLGERGTHGLFLHYERGCV